MIVLEEDCETDKGIVINVLDERGNKIRNLRSRLYGRVLADDLKEGRTLVATQDDDKLRAGTLIGTKELHAIEQADVETVRARSPLTCDTRNGVCQTCYGLSLATGNVVEMGEAVGIMAAQSIGEPGTQLTMRTFHTGGVAGDDITHGLPRVVELFEARTPKGKAVMSEIRGTVHLVDDEDGRRIVVTDGKEEVEYKISRKTKLRASVAEGTEVEAGAQLTDGNLDSQGSPRDSWSPGCPAIPGGPGPGGLQVAGCRNPRQAHRIGCSPDVETGLCHCAKRLRLPAGGADRRSALP